jgi:hypothetical protein
MVVLSEAGGRRGVGREGEEAAAAARDAKAEMSRSQRTREAQRQKDRRIDCSPFGFGPREKIDLLGSHEQQQSVAGQTGEKDSRDE